jgi:glutamine amidotransferase-like uncharacterized protein
MRQVALVYRGPAAAADCAEAAAALLRQSRHDFEVRFVGKGQAFDLSPSNLQAAALYVQPGGGASLERAYRRIKGHSTAIRDYVGGGGRYLGICMGGYLAGHWRGFRLLPDDADQFITSPRASVRTKRDSVVEVDWRGQRRHMFFQDGPTFRVPATAPEVEVLARYASNGQVAALVCPFGLGKVAVSGPHPEAPSSWYTAHGLSNPDGVNPSLGLDLIATLMT